MRLLSTTVVLRGGNYALLLKKLKARKIRIEKAEITKRNKLIITYNSKDDKKVFAICKNMWYNESVSYSGVLYPLKRLISRAGIAIGLLIFTFLLFLSNTFVVKVEYSGDSVYFKNEIDEVLNSRLVKKFSFLKDIDTDGISKDVFSCSDSIAFVSVYKRGYRLVVHTEKSVESGDCGLFLTDKIVAEDDGIIIFLAVYRGTALKKTGESITKGEIIVDGYYTYRDEKRPTDVFAKVIVEYVYKEEIKVNDFSDDSVLRAIELVKFNLGKETVKQEIVLNKQANTVEVKLYYRKTVSGG